MTTTTTPYSLSSITRVRIDSLLYGLVFADWFQARSIKDTTRALWSELTRFVRCIVAFAVLICATVVCMWWRDDRGRPDGCGAGERGIHAVLHQDTARLRGWLSRANEVVGCGNGAWVGSLPDWRSVMSHIYPIAYMRKEAGLLGRHVPKYVPSNIAVWWFSHILAVQSLN